MCWMSALRSRGTPPPRPVQVLFEVPGHLQVGVEHAGAPRTPPPRALGERRAAALDLAADRCKGAGGAVPDSDREAVTDSTVTSPVSTTSEVSVSSPWST